MSDIDNRNFDKAVGLYEKELQSYCYKMLGSFHEAEDALQDVLLSAWKKLDTLKSPAAIRSWLYRIATNTCLNHCKKRERDLVLPYQAFERSGRQETLPPPEKDPIWIEPHPGFPHDDPSAKYERREQIKMAYIVAYQTLSPRLRSILILRDVLDFSAKETAGFLDLTAAAVNSSLIRARDRLREQLSSFSRDDVDLVNLDDNLRILADRFLSLWDESDVDGLISMMRDDVLLAMPPLSLWLEGAANVAEFFEKFVFSKKTMLRRLNLNNQIGFAGYRLERERYVPHTLLVLSISREGENFKINNILSFLNPSLFKEFGMPEEIFQ